MKNNKSKIILIPNQNSLREQGYILINQLIDHTFKITCFYVKNILTDKKNIWKKSDV